MPIGEKYGGATYFMLETHYDNPSKDKDLVDTSGMLLKSLIIMVKAISIGPNTNASCYKINFSGIRIFYTDILRQHDTGMILIGTEVNFLHMIPPQQKSFLSLGRCTSECTSKVNFINLKMLQFSFFILIVTR